MSHVLIDGPTVTVVDPRVLVMRTHDPDECAGRACVIHNPTDHPMRHLPLHWRADRGMFERICEHGVGHPDPSQRDYWRERGRVLADRDDPYARLQDEDGHVTWADDVSAYLRDVATDPARDEAVHAAVALLAGAPLDAVPETQRAALVRRIDLTDGLLAEWAKGGPTAEQREQSAEDFVSAQFVHGCDGCCRASEADDAAR